MPRPLGRALGLLATVVAFQGAWFACVLGAANGWPWAGAAVAAGVAALGIALSTRPASDALLVAVAVLVGLAWDSAMLQLGWIAYAEPGPLPMLAPAWILALWALFAVLGFRRPLVLALVVELVPALQLFPAWTLVVAALAGTETQSEPRASEP